MVAGPSDRLLPTIKSPLIPPLSWTAHDNRLDCLQLSSLFSCNPKSWILFPVFFFIRHHQIRSGWHGEMSSFCSTQSYHSQSPTSKWKHYLMQKTFISLDYWSKVLICLLSSPLYISVLRRVHDSIIARVYEAIYTISTIHTCKSSRGLNIFATGGLNTIWHLGQLEPSCHLNITWKGSIIKEKELLP